MIGGEMAEFNKYDFCVFWKNDENLKQEIRILEGPFIGYLKPVFGQCPNTGLIYLKCPTQYLDSVRALGHFSWRLLPSWPVVGHTLPDKTKSWLQYSDRQILVGGV